MLSPDSPNAFGCSKHRTTHPESPRRACSSPRKKSPGASFYNVPNSMSHLLASYNYETGSADILNDIPEREWRLLAALARKRDDDDEREKLANQFRKLWEKEKKERAIIEAETQDQYHRYISDKRREEQRWHEYQQYQKSLESQQKRKQLLNCIRYKERRSADQRAFIDDKKTSILMEKALEDIARAQLAADRRIRIGEAEQFRKHIELIDEQKRIENARKRRSAILRNATQRVAITNALSSWETSLLRGEVMAMEAARREHHAAHAALTEARSKHLIYTRDARRRRAMKVAVVTEQLRNAIRSGRRSH